MFSIFKNHSFTLPIVLIGPTKGLFQFAIQLSQDHLLKILSFALTEMLPLANTKFVCVLDHFSTSYSCAIC